jgi:hypothetical protein
VAISFNFLNLPSQGYASPELHNGLNHYQGTKQEEETPKLTRKERLSQVPKFQFFRIGRGRADAYPLYHKL